MAAAFGGDVSPDVPASLTRLSQVPDRGLPRRGAAAKLDELTLSRRSRARRDHADARPARAAEGARPSAAAEGPAGARLDRRAADEPRARGTARGRSGPPALPRADAPSRRADRAGRRRAAAARSPTGRSPPTSRSAPRSAPPGSRATCRPRSSASSPAAFELFAARGEFRSAQVHVSIDEDTLWSLVNDLIDRLDRRRRRVAAGALDHARVPSRRSTAATRTDRGRP